MRHAQKIAPILVRNQRREDVCAWHDENGIANAIVSYICIFLSFSLFSFFLSFFLATLFLPFSLWIFSDFPVIYPVLVVSSSLSCLSCLYLVRARVVLGLFFFFLSLRSLARSLAPVPVPVPLLLLFLPCVYTYYTTTTNTTMSAISNKRKRDNGSVKVDAETLLKRAKKDASEIKFEMHPDTYPEDPYDYIHGFGNEHETEALPNALPKARNTPKKCPYGLYAEQLSGTSFTTARALNRRTWFYRIRPTAGHSKFVPYTGNTLITGDFSKAFGLPDQLRWKAFPTPEDKQQVDFVDGLATIMGAGAPETKTGIAVHVYACNTSMKDRAMCNSDGDFLIVPQLGAIDVNTEMGKIFVRPGQICVIPRGITFAVNVEGTTRGYICEVFDGHFQLPDLGPIGSNGLANPRDFEFPVAAYEDRECKFTVVQKYTGQLFSYTRNHSPFDVVAWHGNYAPCKYDLAKFVTVNSVSIDHLDPCTFTVLTCPTAVPGVAACDFAIFPPRWCVQQNTFRPPYYHRNIMSEFMGNILGAYEAKPDGFPPGSGSLHSIMVAHGPDAATFEKASNSTVEDPVYLDGALAFMFESTYMMKLTEWGTEKQKLDEDYVDCWKPLKSHFTPPADVQSSSSSSSSSSQ
jgi:homogentisate 1,2-dioxygenase